jgi:hypothetical protein
MRGTSRFLGMIFCIIVISPIMMEVTNERALRSRLMHDFLWSCAIFSLAIRGDPLLYQRGRSVERGWRLPVRYRPKELDLLEENPKIQHNSYSNIASWY